MVFENNICLKHLKKNDLEIYIIFNTKKMLAASLEDVKT